MNFQSANRNLKNIFPDRSDEKINIIEQYLKATKQFRDYDDQSQDPIFSKVRNFQIQTQQFFQELNKYLYLLFNVFF